MDPEMDEGVGDRDTSGTYTDGKTKMISTPGDFVEEGFVLPGVLSYETTVDEDYVPEGFETVDDYLTATREEYALDMAADQENRNAAIEDKEFAAGEQWDPLVLAEREGLPSFSINTVPQFTAQLVGDWRSNKAAIKVVASDDDDTNTAAIRGDLIRAIEMKARATRIYDDAFESCVTCGDGAFRVTTEYTRDDVFDQDITLKPIPDALSVVWDRMSMDVTGRDARRVFVDDTMPTKEFDAKWPDQDPSKLAATISTMSNTSGWYDDGAVKVTEHWRMIERPRIIAMFGDGSVHALTEENLQQILMSKGQPIRTRVAPCAYAQMHLISGHAILAGPFEFQLSRVPIIRMSGRVQDIAGRRVRYGLVRFMKDSVRLRNFWRSKAAEQLGYSPNAQWIATESAVEGYEDAFRAAHLSRDPLLKVSDEAIIGTNIQRLEPPAPHLALHQEALVNAQDLKDVTGIHDASLGIKSNEVSGKAINARQKEGDIASLTYYDNANAALLEAGDVINQLIPQIYDGTRIIRIIGEDEGAKFVKINDPYDPKAPDLSKGNYDVAISTGSSYLTRRVEAADAMMQAVQVWPQLMEIAGDLVVKAQDWPGAEKFAERLKKAMPPQLTSDDEEENPMQAQIQQALQQAQALAAEAQQHIASLEQQLADKTREYDIKEYDSVTKRISALSDDMVDGNAYELSVMKETLAEEGRQRQHGLAERQHAAQEKQQAQASVQKDTPAGGAPPSSSPPAM